MSSNRAAVSACMRRLTVDERLTSPSPRGQDTSRSFFSAQARLQAPAWRRGLLAASWPLQSLHRLTVGRVFPSTYRTVAPLLRRELTCGKPD